MASGGQMDILELGRAQRSPVTRYLVSTDPAYYHNVGCSDLSDFFYIWLRRCIGNVCPSLFSTLLTPKARELVANPFSHSAETAEGWFKRNFEQAMINVARVVGSRFPVTVFYASKQAEQGGGSLASTGWEAMLAALIGSGLSLNTAWPLRTEMTARLRDKGGNALATSVVPGCRPRSETAGITDRRVFSQPSTPSYRKPFASCSRGTSLRWTWPRRQSDVGWRCSLVTPRS